MEATTATVKDRRRALRGEIWPEETGFLLALVGVMASSGASSTSLTMKAKPTANQLAIRTIIKGHANEPWPAAAPNSVVMMTKETYSWNRVSRQTALR